MAKSIYLLSSAMDDEKVCQVQKAEKSGSIIGCSATKHNAWQRFEKIFSLKSRVNKNLKFECVLCRPSKVFVSTAVTSNSNLRKHLKRIHPGSLEEFNYLSSNRSIKKCAFPQSRTHPKVTKSSHQSTKSNETPISESRLAQLILNIVAESMLPLSFVEQPSFKTLIAACQPGIEMTSLACITRVLEERFETSKAAVKDVLADVEFVATTADCWVTCGRTYLRVTAHWLNQDTFERRSAMLACRRIFEKPHFDLLTEYLCDIYTEYDITSKVVKTITDGGSNFTKAFSVFVPSDEESDCPVLEINNIMTIDDLETPLYQKCAAHLLNLVCTVDTSIAEQTLHCLHYKKLSRAAFAKCQALWNKANQCALAAQQMENEAELQLRCPSDTRWDYVYDAIKRLNKIVQTKGSQALHDICESFDLPSFQDSELEFLASYETIMSPLATALNILQEEADTFMGSLLPTIVYLTKCMEMKKEKLKDSLKIIFHSLLDAITKGIKERFGGIMSNKQVIASTILLPKFKDTWTDDNQQLQRGIQYIKERLEENAHQSHEQDSVDLGDESTKQFFIKKPKNHELEIYLSSSTTNFSIYDDQCTSLKRLALEMNTPIPSSTICNNMLKSTGGLNLRSPRSDLPDHHYEAFLLSNCNKAFS